MNFVALMLAFVLGYFAQHGRHSIVEDINKGFTGYLNWFGEQFTSSELSTGWGGVLMFSLLPAIILGIVVHFISGDMLLFALILHTAVLFICLVPVDPQIISSEDENVADKIIEGYNLIQIIAVVFWYFVLGPVGALLMRLLFIGMQSEKLAETMTTAVYLLKWIPVRLLIISYALVGNFHGVIAATGADCLKIDKDSLELEQRAAESALWPHFDELDEEEGVIQLVALYRRAILCWLTVIALISVTV
jgi:AmpE protein